MKKQRIQVKGIAGYQSTPQEYIRDMLRYDDGKIESIEMEDLGPGRTPRFTAIVQLSRYTPDRWRSFLLTTDVLDPALDGDTPTFTVDEFTAI